MKNNKAFLFISEKDKNFLKNCLKELGYQPQFCEKEIYFLEKLYASPPNLIILDLDCNSSFFETIKIIKSSPIFLEVPLIVLCSLEKLENINWEDINLDDFLVKPFKKIEFIKRLDLAKIRASRILDANPLTKLPGNTTIISKIQQLIARNQDFALGYVDLNHFKAYNDRYGFVRGDEVIKLLARIITNVISNIPGETFVGHIGGDDFVFIVPPEEAEKVAKQIIEYFDQIIPSFYDQEDRKKGIIISKDRKGNLQKFPLMTLAIAIVRNWGNYRLKHYGQAIKVITELKKWAKKDRSKSTYVMERRSSPE
ncbi:MAG: diguanylate cyclase [Candidatus Desulfofervidus auxilii]|nr:diguanylate cyclase [Candidatus Desulfofervidus auxilii]